VSLNIILVHEQYATVLKGGAPPFNCAMVRERRDMTEKEREREGEGEWLCS
jgi:hypothetical protein